MSCCPCRSLVNQLDYALLAVKTKKLARLTLTTLNMGHETMRYNMKHSKQFWLPLATILVLVAVSIAAFADMNASQIVSNFNSMNGDAGFRFESITSQPLVTVTAQAGTNNVDISAYAAGRAGTTSGRAYFTTFCVQPRYYAVTPGVGKLDFDLVTGQTANSSGVVLSLGAATLYKQYATGQLSVTSANVDAFLAALRVLNNDTQQGVATAPLINAANEWATNTFLAGFASNQSYWMQAYDARQRYDEIGDYCVFIMQVTTPGGQPGQDFLYIANATFTPAPGVPEPATLLLWSLGGMGLAGASWCRKHYRKKHTLS